MTHFKKHWWKYLLLALAVIYVITSLVKNEWNPMKWFSVAGTGRQKMCKQDNQGECYVEIGGQRSYVSCSACGNFTI